MNTLNTLDKGVKAQRSGAQQLYASAVLDRFLDDTTQRQRATDLVMGTIRNHVAIDTALSAIADTPAKRINPSLINIVRVAVYEIVYRPSVPEYSIINDAVENAKSIIGKKQAGFVNAVLRKISSRIVERETAVTADNFRATLPNQNGTGCQFTRRLLPDPSRDPASYFGFAYSLPAWLVECWLAEYGYEKTKQICQAANRRPGIYLRPNLTKTNAYKLAELLSLDGITFAITHDEQMLKIDSAKNISSLPGFSRGMFVVQDYSASLAVRSLDPKTDTTILDLCAAPGTKTTQLAEYTKDSACIFATDIDDVRLRKVSQNATRLALNSITVVPYHSLQKLVKINGKFDYVLIDVPCSNSGVLARRPEVRFRLKPKSLQKICRVQDELLDKAADLVKTGGTICYSTCSIERLENQQRIAEFLDRHNDFELLGDNLILPEPADFDHDGAYHAILIRR